MALLLGTLLLILFVWLVSRAMRQGSLAAEPVDERGHRLVEALYKDGIKLGYKRAWDHQLAVEEKRVAAFVRRRALTMGTAASGGVVIASLPLGAALNALPNQGAWLPAWAQWQWLALAALTLLSALGLGLLLMPRDYRRFSGSRRATTPEFAKLESELEALMQAEAGSRLEAVKSYVSALGEERYADGLRQGQTQDSSNLQTRISSAANAAYVQGRADGAQEARTEISQLTTQAYLRGVSDGERAAASKLEGRFRYEREAAYQSGYRVGESEGRAAAAREGRAGQAPGAQAARRPRTRAEALAIFELDAGATGEEVRKRFRELRTAVHPDGMKGRKAPTVMVKFAEEQFKLVGEAYAILEKDL